MNFSFFSDPFGLSCLVSLLLFTLFQILQDTRLTRSPPAPLCEGLINARVDLILRITMSWIALIGPFYSFIVNHTHFIWWAIIPLALLPVLIGLLINPEISTSPDSNFFLKKNIFTQTAQLHQRAPAPIDHAYQELLHLTHTLPLHGINKIVFRPQQCFPYAEKGPISLADLMCTLKHNMGSKEPSTT